MSGGAADVLREAAALMRSRASASQTAFGYGPWKVGGLDEHGQYTILPTVDLALGSRVAADLCEEDAEHIASWHPAVALAVADWLETTADLIDTHMLNGAPTPVGFAVTGPALAVATAYLGTPS